METASGTESELNLYHAAANVPGVVIKEGPLNQVQIRMSELGQTEKNSGRAYVFRFALELGHCSMQSACLKRASNGHGPFNDLVGAGETRPRAG